MVRPTTPDERPRVMTYVSTRLARYRPAQRRDIIDHPNIMVLSLSSGESSFYLLNVYSDSDHGAINWLRDHDRDLPRCHLMMGDFNAHSPDWDPGSAREGCALSLQQSAAILGLELAAFGNPGPTHIPRDHAKHSTVIDLAFVPPDQVVNESTYNENTNDCDCNGPSNRGAAYNPSPWSGALSPRPRLPPLSLIVRSRGVISGLSFTLLASPWGAPLGRWAALGHLKPSLRIVTHVWRGPRARRRRGMGGARGEGKQGGAGRAKVEGGRSGGSGGGEGRYVTFFLVFRKWPAPAKRWPGWWRHGVSAGRTLALLAAALGCRLLRPHLDTLVRVVSEQRQSCCCAPTSSSLWYPSSSGGRAAAAPISPSSWCTSSSDRAAAATDALTSAS
ncbi:hypothetical protein BDZ97DRAFT_1911948 [Flammula alnicola]|nr:hypothetical protein BDZ97DRAFT_1911948 [Flammula alnicola]